MDTIQELVALQKGIDQKTNFTNISINLNTKNNSTGTTKTLNIQAFLAKKTFDIDSVKKSERLKLVEVVKSSYPHLNECDAINVLIRTGFNIGIYSFYYRENTVYDKEGQEIKKGK
jgi:hypothetical protein